MGTWSFYSREGNLSAPKDTFPEAQAVLGACLSGCRGWNRGGTLLASLEHHSSEYFQLSFELSKSPKGSTIRIKILSPRRRNTNCVGLLSRTNGKKAVFRAPYAAVQGGENADVSKKQMSGM